MLAGTLDRTLEQIRAPVIHNRPLTGDYWLLELEAPSMAQALQPGQFVNIRLDHGLVPYTRRPFSVYRVTRGGTCLQIAYKVFGDGTRLMTETLLPGGTCDVIGPLGHGFTIPDGARRIAVVGRGIGIAALPVLVDRAVADGIEVHGFLSARDRANLVAADIFAELSRPVFLHTDEEFPGRKVTEHLRPMLDETPFDAIYVCGSHRLIRDAWDMARDRGILVEAAMEQLMACGFGDCHGCVIEVNLDPAGSEKVYREVCHYGPVFEAWEVLHDDA